MPLITTIQQVQEVLRISNLDEDASLPDMEEAEMKYLQPFIGEAMLLRLQAALDGTFEESPLLDEDGNILLNEEGDPIYSENTLSMPLNDRLLKQAQKVLAAFAYYDDLAIMHARITEGGVRRTTTDNMPSAYRWEYDGVKDYLVEKGYTSLELLLQIIDQNKSILPEWMGSPQYTQRTNLLVKNGAEFTEMYHIHQPYRTFHLLLPCLKDAEKLYIESQLGEEFYNNLKTLETQSTVEKYIIDLIKKAVANFTISLACKKMPVQITAHGFNVNMVGGTGSESTKQVAPDNLLSMTITECEKMAQNYLLRAVAFLNENATGSLFPLYFASSNYTKPDASVPVIKRNHKGVFQF